MIINSYNFNCTWQYFPFCEGEDALGDNYLTDYLLNNYPDVIKSLPHFQGPVKSRILSLKCCVIRARSEITLYGRGSQKSDQQLLRMAVRSNFLNLFFIFLEIFFRSISSIACHSLIRYTWKIQKIPKILCAQAHLTIPREPKKIN